jgi:hypothetical protein
MEDQVVENYVIRLEQAEKISCNSSISDMVDGTYVALFLENQILDSRADADNIREMLANSY